MLLALGVDDDERVSFLQESFSWLKRRHSTLRRRAFLSAGAQVRLIERHKAKAGYVFRQRTGHHRFQCLDGLVSVGNYRDELALQPRLTYQEMKAERRDPAQSCASPIGERATE